jgi:Mn2+/Fe2+ NRAMP family transporter
VQAEVVAITTDLAEVIGGAVALYRSECRRRSAGW